MNFGTLYGIGIGPGDPDLISVKGAKLLGDCRHVIVPKAKPRAESLALAIAGKHIRPDAVIHEMVFPMVTEPGPLNRHWEASADRTAEALSASEDACYLTLGDPMLYSTYIYLIRALKQRHPQIRVSTVPGITAFSAAAALTDFPIGEAKTPVIIVPTADDPADLQKALESRATVILMKVGNRLPRILRILEEHQALDRSVLVSRAGLPDQRIETDLRQLANDPQAGYLSIILVQATDKEAC